jgi:hypothetical protein
MILIDSMKLFEHFKKFSIKNEKEFVKDIDIEFNTSNEQTSIPINSSQPKFSNCFSNLKTKQNVPVTSNKETNTSINKHAPSNFCFDNYAYGSFAISSSTLLKKIE